MPRTSFPRRACARYRITRARSKSSCNTSWRARPAMADRVGSASQPARRVPCICPRIMGRRPLARPGTTNGIRARVPVRKGCLWRLHRHRTRTLAARHSVQSVMIMGFYAHMCLSTSAREALVRGFEVAVDPNATGARDLEDEAAGSTDGRRGPALRPAAPKQYGSTASPRRAAAFARRLNGRSSCPSRQCLTQSGSCIGNGSLTAPGDESVRANQDGAVGRDAVCRRPALFDIAQISRRADAMALKSSHTCRREFADEIRPRAAGRSSREHPVAGEKIDRGRPLTVALHDQLRRTRARPPRRRARVLERLGRDSVSVGDKCAGRVPIPEDDRVVVDDRLGRRQLHAWILEPGLQARQRLRHRAIRNRPTFVVVAVEQRSGPPSLE